MKEIHKGDISSYRPNLYPQDSFIHNQTIINRSYQGELDLQRPPITTAQAKYCRVVTIFQAWIAVRMRQTTARMMAGIWLGT